MGCLVRIAGIEEVESHVEVAFLVEIGEFEKGGGFGEKVFVAPEVEECLLGLVGLAIYEDLVQDDVGVELGVGGEFVGEKEIVYGGNKLRGEEFVEGGGEINTGFYAITVDIGEVYLLGGGGFEEINFVEG